MANSTIYDIRLRYMLEDRASKGLKRMDENLAKTAKSSGMLGRQFGRMAVAAGAAFGFRAASKALIGYNATMQQSKIQIAGMLQLAGKMDTTVAKIRADALVATLQQKAKASVGTTEDMVAMASLITRPILAAGLGMEELGDFTAQAVVAAKAFGIESGMAARDIESAMMGQLRSVDRFARNLLEPLGVVGEEGRKAFNELGAAARAAKLKEALGQGAITDMANNQAKSFDGVLSTFKDGLQIALGQVGKPLFKELTNEIASWSVWMDKNKKALGEMGKTIGGGLVKGFKVVKSVLSFMVDHKDLLITVAKAWAAVKLGQGIGGMVQNMTSKMGGGMMGFGRKIGVRGLGLEKTGLLVGKFGNKIMKAGLGFAKLIPGIGLAAVALTGIWSWWKGRKSDEEKQRAIDKGAADQAVERYDFSKTGTEESAPGVVGTAASRINELEFHVNAAKREGGILSARGTQLAASLEGQTSEMRSLYQAAADVAFGSGIIDDKGIPSTNNINDIKRMAATEMRRLGVAPEFARPGSDQNDVVVNAIVELGTNLGSTIEQRQERMLQALEGGFIPGHLAEALEMMRSRGSTVADDTTGKKPKINVTIQRIEVQSDDPDRFVFQLSEITRKLARNPSQAPSTQRLGGR